MNRLFCAALAAAICSLATTASAQERETHADQVQTPGQHAASRQGPRGGTIRQVDDIQIETVVETGGLRLFVYDRAGKSMSAGQGRGIAWLHVPGGAKRYRYDLLPDERGLSAPVNLSKLAGRQIELNFHLVGLGTAGSQPILFNEVATVPASPEQLAAAAIARQKVCPVSGKPLGSMGAPIAVEVNAQTVYVCCAGCVEAVKNNPAKYATGRPVVTVVEATTADARLVAEQATCPVMDEPLGSMGRPIKVMVGDKPIFLCCKGCIKKVQADPAKYLAMVYGDSTQGQPRPSAAEGEEVRAGVFKTTATDAPFVAAQKRCPVMDEPLDAMGGPYRVNAEGRAIYICCPACAKKIVAEPQKYIAILAEQGVDPPVLR